MARYTRRSWQAIRPNVDIGQMPMRIDLSPQRGRMIMLVAAGVVWLGVPYWIFSDTLRNMQTAGAPNFVLWGVLAFSAIPLVMIGQGIVGLAKSRVAIIDHDVVTVSGRSFLSRENWRENLHSYAGIAHREDSISRKNHIATYQIIELVHADTGKTILLDVIRGATPPQQRSNDFARTLQMALVDEGGHTRAVGDLDKPLRQQAEDGAITSTYDPAASIPSGLSITRHNGSAGGAIKITLDAPRIPNWLIIGFIAVVLLVTSLSVLQNGLSFGTFVVIVIVAAAISLRQYDRAKPRVLEVTREEIVLHDIFNRVGGPGPRAALRHDTIKQIYISGSRGQVLAIATDRLTLSTGGGLSHEALNWLKAYLIAAIANA